MLLSLLTVQAVVGSITAQWSANLEGSGNDLVNAVAIDSSDSVVMVSTFDRLSWLSVPTTRSLVAVSCPTDSAQCAMITKLSANGTFLWRAYVVSPYDYSASTRGVDVTVDGFGNVLATVAFGSLYVGIYDANGTPKEYISNTWSDVADQGVDSSDCSLVAKWSSNGTYLWAARFDGDGDELLRSVVTDNQGSVYVGGMSDSWDIEVYERAERRVRVISTYCEEGPCGAVIKYNATGTFQWVRLVTNLIGYQYVQDMALDLSGNLLVAGYAMYASTIRFRNTAGTSIGTLTDMGPSNAGFLLSLTTDGAFGWATRLRNAIPNSIARGPDNNVVMAGQIVSSSAVLFDRNLAQVATIPKIGTTGIFLAKYTNTGTFIWSMRMTGLTTSSSETAFAVTIDKQNNVIVGGEFFSVPLTIFDANDMNVTTIRATGSSGGFMAKFTPSGTLMWTCRLDSVGRDYVLGLTTDSLNDVVVAGVHNGQATLFDSVGNPSMNFDVSAVNPGSSGVMLVMAPDGVWPYTPPVARVTTTSTTLTSETQQPTPSSVNSDNSNNAKGSETAAMLDVDIFTISFVAGGALVGSFAAVFGVIFKTRRSARKTAQFTSDTASLLSGPVTASTISQILAGGAATVTRPGNRTQTQVATTHELSIPAFLERKWGIDFREGTLIAAGGGGSLFTCEALNPEWKEVRNQSLVVKKIGESLDRLNARQQRQFFQELSIMWKFRDNRTFCRVYGFSISPVSLVMRFYELGDLCHYIEGRGVAARQFSYTKYTVVRIAREFVSAIKTLHEAGIAHCDIKTANVLLDRDPFGQLFPVVTDFGISRIVAEMQVKAFEKSDINGMSILYAAPEIFNRIRASAPMSTDDRFFMRADVYSVAMLLYSLMTRLEPWS